MFVWRKHGDGRWFAAHETELRAAVDTQLAIIKPADRKKSSAEVASRRRRPLEKLRARFGGSITKLPHGWLGRMQNQRAEPIRVGKRLVVLRSRTSASTSAELVIPAGAAFGTGEHATTAMSLRLLEQASRKLSNGWSMLDFGTGSGILALAAKTFGAGKVIAVDLDPTAIATAKANARANAVGGIDFHIADARQFSDAAKVDMVVANLFSELLIELLPNLKRCRRLILSGILGAQEKEVERALKRNGFAIFTTRRRGKWVAILAGNTGS